MTYAEGTHPDAAILEQIRGLTAQVTDAGSRGILKTVVDAVALNPQPLPPVATLDIVRSIIDAVALNPQPLPPEPPPR